MRGSNGKLEDKLASNGCKRKVVLATMCQLQACKQSPKRFLEKHQYSPSRGTVLRFETSFQIWKHGNKDHAWGKIVLVVAKTMKNPRSALCKTSVMVASDIFNAFGDKLLDLSTSEEAFDGLLFQLLLKASQDKKFVGEEADRALGIMVGSMTPLPFIQKLRAYVSHKNLRVGAKAVVSLTNCVSKMMVSGA